MYQLYIALLNDWRQVGGALFVDAGLAAPAEPSGFWGVLPTVLATGSQEYDALLSYVEPAGDANLNGIVDYADFQALAANYGNLNAFWEQGDFNADGMVNWQDLNILKQNLDPAGFTLGQFAQAAVFGQPSTIVPGQALEYDGYGVTYASSMPTSASSGTVKLNANSQGTAIVLGGATYSEGLGVLANSSISLTLNGQQSRFDSTIGVDGSSTSVSSVIFEVYGDGQLLYQSPTLTYASGAIPIDINVIGVTTLTLSILAAPGSSPSADHAVWADARLISTANFGLVQPYILTWQLSQNGVILSTQTADSFVFGASSGTYTLVLTVTDAEGDAATASTSVVVSATPASAQFITVDSRTKGNWIGSYGAGLRSHRRPVQSAKLRNGHANGPRLHIPGPLVQPIPGPYRSIQAPLALPPVGSRRPVSRSMSTLPTARSTGLACMRSTTRTTTGLEVSRSRLSAPHRAPCWTPGFSRRSAQESFCNGMLPGTSRSS